MNDASEARTSGKGSYDATGRSAVDLDELERQLRQMASPRSATSTSDPLAELARLVEQADPFSSAREGRAATPTHAQQPALHSDDALAALERALQAGPQRTSVPAEQPFTTLLSDSRFAEAAQPSYEAHATSTDDMQPARDALEAFLRRAPEPQRNDPFAGHVVDTAFERVPQQAADNSVPYQATSSPQANPYVASYQDAEAYDPASYQPAAYDASAYRAAVNTAPVDQGYGAQPEYGVEPDYAEPDYTPLEQRRSRKGLVTVAAVLGVGALGLALALSLRGGEPKAPSGEPPVVRAETGPTRVQPVNPGGVDIPNQNKQIYDRAAGGTSSPSNVVNNTEQPVDLNQVVRNVAPRVVGGATGDAAASAAQTPAGQAPVASPPSGVAAVLGEPKRVKTVSVRPDGTIVGSTEAAPVAAIAAVAPVQPRPPSISGATPSAASPVRPVGSQPTTAPTVAVPAPAGAQRATGGDLSAAANAASAPLSISPAPNSALPKSQQRITAPATTPAPAAAAPQVVARAPAPAQAPAPLVVAPAATGGGGDFAVQLAAPGSEKEARDLFASLQRRFPGELGGVSPTIRRAEVGDRTIYRLRVGAMDRSGAVAMCERLKAAGGQCFVARN